MFQVNLSFIHATLPQTIRFTESLHRELKELAGKMHISFNVLVLQCCRYALDNLYEEEK